VKEAVDAAAAKEAAK
jgi:hypothetical protein